MRNSLPRPVRIRRDRVAEWKIRQISSGIASDCSCPDQWLTKHAHDSSRRSYPSYTCDFWGNPVLLHCVPSKRIISGDDIGVGPLNQPRDLFVDSNRNVK